MIKVNHISKKVPLGTLYIQCRLLCGWVAIVHGFSDTRTVFCLAVKSGHCCQLLWMVDAFGSGPSSTLLTALISAACLAGDRSRVIESQWMNCDRQRCRGDQRKWMNKDAQYDGRRDGCVSAAYCGRGATTMPPHIALTDSHSGLIGGACQRFQQPYVASCQIGREQCWWLSVAYK